MAPPQHVYAVLFASLLTACASQPASFPIRTDPAARSLLTGEWAGSYSGGLDGRSGSITFQLQGGDSSFTQGEGEHAHGDVLMVPNRQNDPNDRQSEQPRSETAAGPDANEIEVLTIQFVRARGTHLTGTLKPYHDPACNCSITTTFVGEIRGDTITGTFTANASDGTSRTGQWEVERKKP